MIVGDYPNEYLKIIEDELSKLDLKLSPSKTIIVPVKHGIDFVGAEIKPFRKHLRTKTKKHASYRITTAPSIPTISSYISLAHSNGSYTDMIDFCELALEQNYSILMKFNTIPRVRNYATRNHATRNHATRNHAT